MAPHKPIAPSPQKLAEARERWGVPHSDLIGLGLGVMTLGVWWSSLRQSWIESYRGGLESVMGSAGDPSMDVALSFFKQSLGEAALGWLTLLTGGSLIAVLLHGGRHGSGSHSSGKRYRSGVLLGRRPSPSLWSGFLLGLWMLGLGVAALPLGLSWIYGSGGAIAEGVSGGFMQIALVIGAGTTLLGLADLLWQRSRWFGVLRMTRPEARERLRREQGDPQWRRYRRNVSVSAARQDFQSMMREAYLVISGYADCVFLLQEASPPRLVASERGFRGVELLRMSARHSVRTLRNPDLCRILLRVRVGGLIPRSAYDAVHHGYVAGAARRRS